MSNENRKCAWTFFIAFVFCDFYIFYYLSYRVALVFIIFPLLLILLDYAEWKREKKA